MKDDEQRPA
jgi:hypothetical protein